MDNPERVTYFGATDTRGKRTPFGIKSKDRDRHMYVIGKTGMGKSTLLENMAIQDLRNGEGLAFIDPHGGTADKLLDYIPKNRIKDVVYFAPFDLDQPIAFNVMEDVGYDKRHLVVSGLMATFKKIWEDAWSARMEYILTNTLLALLEYPNATLLGVNKMYTDKAYRKKVVDNLKDPVVKDFWTKEFANYGERYTQEATPAIQNKIGQFTGNPLIRNIIGQPKSSFDIRQMMDDKKILIINLSKGQVGETNMRLLGSMLTTRIFLSAMSRADLSGTDLARLPHFYFYVDEFQNFANDTFAEILSEARKYHLNLIIAHQYVEQMEEQVRAAVFGNVGTTIAFRVGPFDAETLETVFSPEFMKEDIVNLSIRQIYISLMIDGVGSRPFSAVTIPPIALPPVTYKKEVIEASRQQFGEKRADIEAAVFAEISEDHGAKDAKEAKEAKEAESKEKESSASREPRPRVTSASTRSSTTDSTRSSSSPSRSTTTRSSSSNSGTNSSSANTAPRTNAASSQTRTPEPRRAMTASPQPERSTHIETRTERPAPKPAVQTSEDLKSILRAMTANNPPPAKPAVRPTAPLKDALAGVLKDTKPSQATQGHSSTQTQQPTAAKSQKPFEVPEETLKALFKDQ